VFRYANGLVVHTDPFMAKNPARVLPIGGPQDAIMNRLLWLPEQVAGKRVFDPFSGSGVLGLLALRLGAAQVDFLDISPRAQSFQLENAKRNGFDVKRYRALLGSIEDFRPDCTYDLVLANPPFVPTPDGLAGTLTSNGGGDGNTLVEALLGHLDGLLHADGQAFIYVMQLVAAERPLITDALLRHLPERSCELTPTQAALIPLAQYVAAYRKCFPAHEPQIASWQSALLDRHGAELGIGHYIVHVQPKRPGAASWSICENLPDKYGRFAYPAAANGELALSRVLENFVSE
jgi:release factor glutamine methyltransferase